MAVRIISGRAGGLQLRLPKGTDVRPTMDRVKSAIFSILGERVINARVLDLFAGTGALGIEALSRGAASVVFVDSDSRVVTTIQANLSHAGLDEHATSVVRADALHFIQRHACCSEPFDIIFADPPYTQKRDDFDPGLELIRNPALAASLNLNGFFILERRTGEPLPSVGSLQIRDCRKYGRTTVFFLSHGSG